MILMMHLTGRRFTFKLQGGDFRVKACHQNFQIILIHK